VGGTGIHARFVSDNTNNFTNTWKVI